MSYITPNSIVEFFADIGLSDNYTDSWYFPDTDSKDSFFDSLPKITTAEALSYGRITNGSFRVEKTRQHIINAGYIRFKNTDFEDKWFYAFVTNMEYINNVTTEVSFELDYIMTYMGDFNLGSCFVERQHVENDSIGANIADEGLQCGNYINEFMTFEPTQGSLVICILFADEEGSGYEGGLGLYSGCSPHFFLNSDDANDFLAEHTTLEAEKSKIVSIFMVPAYVMSGNRLDFPIAKPYFDIAGYTPKNNKLFCYPYKYLEVDNMEGTHAEYMYEYFNTLPPESDSSDMIFQFRGQVSGTAQVLCLPDNYKGIEGHNWEESISMSHFPQCSYAIDSYEAYLAQQNSNMPLTLAKSAITGALSGASAGAIGATPFSIGAGAIGGAIMSAGSVAASMLASYLTRPEQGVEMKGSQSTDIAAATQDKKFRFYGKSITANYAAMIDDYFTAFGYAIRNWRVPNMCARPVFTYIKTVGCNLSGNLPADHGSRIESIFNNGIRLWNRGHLIGDYDTDNSPVFQEQEGEITD